MTKEKTDEILYVDIHEAQDRVELARARFRGIVEVVPLPTGDYVCGDMAFEWKQDDFVQSCYKRLIFQQMEELKEVYPNSYLIVAKNFNNIAYRFKHRNMAVGSVSSLIRRGHPPIFATNQKLAMDIMISTFHKHLDGGSGDIDTAFRTKLTPRRVASDSDWQLQVLQALPKLGEKKAKEILAHFGSLKAVINASPEDLKKIKGVKKLAERWHAIINAEYKE